MIRPLDAYVYDGIMLERYGISYVCRHPEILFGIPTVPEGRGFRNRGDRLNPDRDMPDLAYDRRRPVYVDDPILRAMEAYKILAELYAPYDGSHVTSSDDAKHHVTE